MESLIIDRHFIEYWHPRYDSIEHDEVEYQEILKDVKYDIETQGTLTQTTFRRILKWKTRNRANRNVKWDEYDKYARTFHDSLFAEEDEKVKKLIVLGGIKIPVASTILHFIYPDHFPIIDERTVSVLKSGKNPILSGTLYHYIEKIEGYREFRDAIKKISIQNDTFSYREIDRALFTYHKYTLKKLGTSSNT